VNASDHNGFETEIKKLVILLDLSECIEVPEVDEVEAAIEQTPDFLTVGKS